MHKFKFERSMCYEQVCIVEADSLKEACAKVEESMWSKTSEDYKVEETCYEYDENGISLRAYDMDD